MQILYALFGGVANVNQVFLMKAANPYLINA